MTTQTFQFSNAEIAVIFQQLLGPDLPPESDMLADLKVDPAAVAAARKRLVERGLMHAAPDPDQVAFDPAILALFQAVTRPEVLGILQIGIPDKPGREMYFSWTPERIVRNFVDENGDHHLELLSAIEEVGQAAVRESGIESLGQVKPDLAGNPETVITGASLRAVFMAVANMQSADQDSQAASWVVKDGQLWLITRQEGENGAMEPVTAETIRETVASMVMQAVDQTLAAQA
jgi:hypothetical protein